jgi:hypothetical protein
MLKRASRCRSGNMEEVSHKGVVGRELKRVGEKLYAWVVGMWWKIKRARVSQEGWDLHGPVENPYIGFCKGGFLQSSREQMRSFHD